MLKRLYYNIIIVFKVWLASINPKNFEYAINYEHERWILDDYKQRLQWHYFGMPQYIKDHFYYQAKWETLKRKYHDEWLENTLRTPPLPQSVKDELTWAQIEYKINH